MKVANFVLQDYCNRIGFKQEPDASIGSVSELMRRQLFNVPFENLDVQAGKLVSLVPEEIVQKIVYGARGGYCYEVNSLFAMALHALDINYFLVGARPMFYPTKWAKTHMVVVATIAGKQYLCDCGFGRYGIRAPIALDNINIEIQQDDDRYRLLCDDGKNYTLQAFVDGEWASQYGFDLYPHELIDFMPANFFNSKSPDTVFVQKLLVVKYNEAGRKILLGNSLKTIEHGVTSLREISASDIPAVLAQEFGLAL